MDGSETTESEKNHREMGGEIDGDKKKESSMRKSKTVKERIKYCLRSRKFLMLEIEN